MKRIIYRCKRKSCGKVRRVEYPLLRSVDLGGGHTRKIFYRLDLFRGEVLAGHDAVCVCGSQVSGDEVKATPSNHPCDPRCINATGSICECSCGGKNHGGAYDAGIEESQESFAWA